MRDDRSLDIYQEEPAEQEINIRDYLSIVRKRLPIIVTVAFIVFFWQVLKVYTTTPVYTASSNVLVEKNLGSGKLDYQYSGYDPYFLSTQTEIIRSENVARRVVENLQLDKKYRQYFFPEKPRKKSFFAEMKSSLKETIKSILPIGQVKEAAGEDGNAAGFDREVYTDADIIAKMIRGGLEVSPMPESKIVNITYSHENPSIAKLVANAVVQAYKDVTLDIKVSSTSYELQWMTEKAEEERKKLEDAENALQKYKRENDLVTVENRLAVIPEKLSQINSEFTNAQTERRDLENIYTQITNARNDMAALERIPIFSTNTVIQAIREKIFRARQNIEELSKKYGPKHPVMINAKDELEILNNEMKFEVDRIIASTKNSYELAESREKNLRELLGSTKSELLTVNEKFVQLSIMQREVDTNRVLYDTLTSSIKRTGVTEQAQSVNIWVARNAELPQAPSFPNKKRALALGLILGLALGGGLAFFLEYLDNTVKSEKDLLAKFDSTVLGTVTQLKGKGENIESYILRQPLSPLAESYRLVRSNLLLSSAERPPKTILITSMGAQEGKTSTSINTARILSQDDKKVLIIDCDLRRPRMHEIFGVDNTAGLSNYLSGNKPGSILHDVPGEDIKLIPSGPVPPNPAELLNSRKMMLLVKKMEETFDFIIIDSPPIQLVTDSLAISRIVDGTIVVVRARKTTNDMLYSGMRKLSDVNANFLGFILNGMSKSDAGSGYYSGYNTYYAKN
ncbi:GumC family protein [Desulfopila inferna]|uniref:GumC family protein n=1 Tax=Desulfopila inferna TaxID=468528 RepID=UPI001962E5AD|nr:polysaccharide biosynthesis tyrosine autokinase [Desulfopila inferna]MBM9605811.1 polysaccharide biosynthesis tyrosine autokinase [Desulfopila inferna]